MHDFVAHVLRKYYSQTDWNPFNSYLYLTNSSQAVLDFAVPHGLSLSISASPSPPFFTNYRLRALPSLTGALGYIFASIEDKEGNVKPLNLGGSSRDIRFKEFVDKFRIIESPRRPIGKEEIWQAGKRVDKRDYLLYGCMHIPSARVDALVTTRLSPTWQLLVTAISMAPRNPLGLSSQSSYSSNVNNERTNDGNNSVATAPPVISGPPPGSTNLHFNLQRDTGRWFTEYSYSVDDGLLGFRVLHNLGHVDISNPSSGNTGLSNSNGINGQPLNGEEQGRRQRVDEETGLESAVGGGLQGRFSVGAEVFFSPLEKSAGLSTGMRFTTLPENNIASASTSSPMGNPTSGLAANVSDGNDGNSSSSSSFNPSQPPTTITATLNPMMGHLSTAYAARMTRDIVACSRFDFNVYSYESELTLGAEYWLRSSTISNILNDTNITASILPQSEEKNILENNALTQTSERRLSSREQTGLSLRDGLSSFQGQRNPNMADGIWSLRERGSVHGDDETSSIPVASMTLSGKEEPNEGHAIPPPSTLSTSPAVATSDSPLTSSSFLSQFRTLGVLKGRISTSGIAALLWEGKMRNCLVSFGIRGDLSSNELMGGGIGSGKPLRAVGIDVIYFS